MPAHGRDRVGAELLAQVADVDVDDVGAGVEVEAPDLVEQLLAGQHLAGVGHEDLGERELARRQVDLLAADGGPAGAEVEADAAGLEDVGRDRRRCRVRWRSRRWTRASSSANRNGLAM